MIPLCYSGGRVFMDGIHIEGCLGDGEQMSTTNIYRFALMADNWNEWGEGHFIYPAELAGVGYVNAFHSVFGKGRFHQNVAPRLGYSGSYRKQGLKQGGAHPDRDISRHLAAGVRE